MADTTIKRVPGPGCRPAEAPVQQDLAPEPKAPELTPALEVDVKENEQA